MKEITLIELMNKLSRGEEVPKRIKYGITIWKYEKEYNDYHNSSFRNPYCFLLKSIDPNHFNDKVQIIEDMESCIYQDIIDYIYRIAEDNNRFLNPEEEKIIKMLKKHEKEDRALRKLLE